MSRIAASFWFLFLVFYAWRKSCLIPNLQLLYRLRQTAHARLCMR